MCPQRCMLLPAARKKGIVSLTERNDFIVLAQKVVGLPLRQLAETTADETLVRTILKSAAAHLKTIHSEWGF